MQCNRLVDEIPIPFEIGSDHLSVEPLLPWP
jgi:hypothetical protein